MRKRNVTRAIFGSGLAAALAACDDNAATVARNPAPQAQVQWTDQCAQQKDDETCRSGGTARGSGGSGYVYRGGSSASDTGRNPTSIGQHASPTMSRGAFGSGAAVHGGIGGHGGGGGG